jgi:hypothetical protein
MMKNNAIISFVFCIIGLAAIGRADGVQLQYSDLLAPPPPVSGTLMASALQDQPSSLDMLQPGQRHHVSMKKALLLSVLLPGAGQYYADAKFKGQVFMGVEATIWSVFIAYRVYGGWKKDDYKDFAAAHAGVDNTGKDNQFYDWVGFYNNREEFNQFGRLYYPDRDYLPDNKSYYWQWDSEANRMEFKNIKNASETAFRNSSFLIGLAIINRVIAGIDTYRTVKAAQAKMRSFSQIGPYKITVKPKFAGINAGLSLKVTRKF